MIVNDCCCICGTVKNCGKYLKKVFKNIEKIINIFKEYYIIIYYDHSDDDTLEQLLKFKQQYKMHIHVNRNFKSNYRTHRLAYGRNYCLHIINKYFSNYNYFIMMDFDDVCSNEINISVLEKYIDRNETWDAISFNKENYYDIWALSIRPYIFSYAHFNNPHEVLHNMQRYIKNKLESIDGTLIPCYSAFNGFCLYKTQIFKDCKYDGNIRFDMIPTEYLKETLKANNSEIVFIDMDWLNSKHEDCEHRSFHFEAIKKNNARIFISPEILIK
jgi:hypothetical protein